MDSADLMHRVKFLEATVAQLAQSIEQRHSDKEDSGFEDNAPDTGKVSNTVLKPRTFEETDELRKSVYRYYHDRLNHRMNELEKLSEIDDEISITGCLNLPENMRHVSDAWTLYLDLLTQYCEDVEDLLQAQIIAR
jgi:hypothetical protein